MKEDKKGNFILCLKMVNPSVYFKNLAQISRQGALAGPIEAAVSGLNRLGQGGKVYILYDGLSWHRKARKVLQAQGLEILTSQELTYQVQRLEKERGLLLLDGSNDTVNFDMIGRMLSAYQSADLDYLYFKPTFGIPFNIASVEILNGRALKMLVGKNRFRWHDLSSALKGCQDLKVGYYHLQFEDKLWMYSDLIQKIAYPRVIGLETTSVCNLRCKMCPQHTTVLPRKARPVGYMDFDLYRKIVNEMPKSDDVTLVLHGYGEPLLHKKIIDMVRYAKKKGVSTVTFATNGMLLTGEMSKSLLRAGLDGLDISIDGLEKKTFEEIRQGASHEKVVAHVHDFIRIRGRARRPVLNIRFVEQQENQEESEGFINYWIKISDRVTIDKMHDEGRLGYEVINRFPCPALWFLTEIFWDGRVPLCNMDYSGSLILGELRDTSLMEVWQGPALHAVRERHLSGDFSLPEICLKCGWWQCYDTWIYGADGPVETWENPISKIYQRLK